MIKETEEILATHFLYLPADEKPISHNFTKDMSQKSELVSKRRTFLHHISPCRPAVIFLYFQRTIRVINENPASMFGMLRIMEKLTEHVSKGKNGIEPVLW